MKVIVGKGSCGIAAGADKVSEYIARRASEEKIDIDMQIAGCIGMCYLEPLVIAEDSKSRRKMFAKVDQAVADEIILWLAGRSSRASEHEVPDEDMAILNSQTRIALRNCGIINPESLDAYIKADGYKAIDKCIGNMLPEDVINEIRTSGLAGRGGAGFPTWFKWRAARRASGSRKYMICNADEGDPGAFMDRSVIEGDPHALIEGMLIGAYAVGASEGIVYVRAEYPLAIKRLEKAIEQARAAGYLGGAVLGSAFSFDIRIKAGAGAFVCGEETALLASLEGERGMPRLKPPFPAEKGFFQRPSNINNVETYANAPWIILNGGAAFAAMGSPDSKGTKVFALTGKVKKGGLVEIPMGSTIKDVIFSLGGGIKDGKAFKAVQMGGPSGGCIPASLSHTKIDYKALAATGAIMGSGGMVVMDGDTCMVDMARFFLDFTCNESCGKCVHCRIGTKRMLELLERITKGEGEDGDIEKLESLAAAIKDGALCGLGQTAPNPVLTAIKYFRSEYEDHIYRKKCSAKQCAALLTYKIDKGKCVGCTLCARNCPVKAISGETRKPHEIDGEACVKCGKCKSVCRFAAVLVD
ncbi:MAG: NADH-quinone oxidoreductase subunit NuoF [Clostridiales bacterium]|jgi:NADH-quinone oxidoreductase subunit F|nr:NADH-quinone oxidoreductase subunit NuoF [Clostridiales bacterium]